MNKSHFSESLGQICTSLVWQCYPIELHPSLVFRHQCYSALPFQLENSCVFNEKNKNKEKINADNLIIEIKGLPLLPSVLCCLISQSHISRENALPSLCVDINKCIQYRAIGNQAQEMWKIMLYRELECAPYLLRLEGVEQDEQRSTKCSPFIFGMLWSGLCWYCCQGDKKQAAKKKRFNHFQKWALEPLEDNFEEESKVVGSLSPTGSKAKNKLFQTQWNQWLGFHIAVMLSLLKQYIFYTVF